MIINIFSGEIVEQEASTIKKGPRCRYCGNTRWRIQKIHNKQACSRCGLVIPLQDDKKSRQPVMQCETDLLLQE